MRVCDICWARTYEGKPACLEHLTEHQGLYARDVARDLELYRAEVAWLASLAGGAWARHVPLIARGMVAEDARTELRSGGGRTLAALAAHPLVDVPLPTMVSVVLALERASEVHVQRYAPYGRQGYAVMARSWVTLAAP